MRERGKAWFSIAVLPLELPNAVAAEKERQTHLGLALFLNAGFYSTPIRT